MLIYSIDAIEFRFECDLLHTCIVCVLRWAMLCHSSLLRSEKIPSVCVCVVVGFSVCVFHTVIHFILSRSNQIPSLELMHIWLIGMFSIHFVDFCLCITLRMRKKTTIKTECSVLCGSFTDHEASFYDNLCIRAQFAIILFNFWAMHSWILHIPFTTVWIQCNIFESFAKDKWCTVMWVFCLNMTAVVL